MSVLVATIQLHAWGCEKLAAGLLPGPSALIRIADEPDLLSPIYDQENVVACLDVICNDADENYQGVVAPDRKVAEDILQFASTHCLEKEVPHLVVQCDAGVGRSVAVCAALDRIWNHNESRPPFGYNRTLYRRLVELGDGCVPAEPLVSLAVRVKYGPDRLGAFLLSMLRQRYDNWEVVAYTDGPNDDAQSLVEQIGDERVHLIETPQRRGHWGHPYRQMALSHCTGDWIGTQNDDNYLTPGYLEQMVAIAEDESCDVVCCQMLHRYSSWGVVPPGGDLCSWLARGELVHRIPWDGTGFTADREYLNQLVQAVGMERVVTLNRPLVVKN